VTEEDTGAVMDVLSLLHLEHLSLVPFARLSGGQQKLVSIAQTLARKPQLVLMDEPTNSLDLHL
jgi:iron(III) dicitrate ABC transporter, ATP-binding protein FecE